MNDPAPAAGSCLDATTLARLAANEPLPDGVVVEAAAHLATCRKCLARLEQERETLRFIADFQQRLHAGHGRGGEWGAEGTEAIVSRELVGAGTGAAQTGEHRLHDYELLEEIAAGAQGTVVRAIHEPTGRVVAIKILRSTSTRSRARLAREARLAARLRHASVVAVHDCGTLPDGRFAIVMDLIDGVPLDEWGRRVDREADSHRARLKRKLEVAIQICRAVAHAHVHAVIHRDLKPTNILIDGRDRASVLDFGVSHAIDGVDRPVTVTGEFTGTLAYSAPEELQRTGAASDARTDIYSLGVLIHQLVTGHLPHDDGLPVHGLIEAIVHQQAAVRPADSTGNRIGRDLETILLKALSNDPDRRYQSGAALADDLVRFLEGAPIEARRDSTLYLLGKLARRHRVVVALGAVMLAILVAATVGVGLSAKAAHSAALDLADGLRSARIREAQALAQGGAVRQAEHLLWQEVLAPSSPRVVGAEGHHPGVVAGLWGLRSLARSSPVLGSTILDGAPACGLAFEPAGTGLTVVQEDGDVLRLSIPDLAVERLTRLTPAPVRVSSTAVLQALVDGARNRVHMQEVGTDRIDSYELSSGRRIASIAPVAGRSIAAVTLLADGRVAAMYFEGGVSVVSPDGDDVLALWRNTPAVSKAMQIQCDDGESVLAYVTMDGTIACVDERSGEVRAVVSRPNWVPHESRAMTFSKPGHLLFVDRAIVEWQLEDGHARTVAETAGRPMFMTVSPGGRWLALGKDRGPIEMHDLRGGHPVVMLAGLPISESRGSRLVAFSPDGTSFALAGGDGVLRLWSTQPRGPDDVQAIHSQTVHWLGASADGDGAWSVAPDGLLARVDSSEVVSVRTIPTTARVVRAATSPDDGWLVTDERTTPPTFVVRHLDTLETSGTPVVCGNPAGPFAFSPDSTQLAAGSGVGAVTLVDLRTNMRRELHEIGRGGVPRVLAFSPDGQTLAFGTLDAKLYLVPTMATVLPPAIDLLGAPHCLTFSPDGRHFVIGHEDGRVTRWDTRTGRNLDSQPGHSNMTMAAAYSPDGSCIATASYDGEVRIWSAEGLVPLATLTHDGVAFHTLAFSHDGRRLMAGDVNGRVVTWDLALDDRLIANSIEFWIAILEKEGIEPTNAKAMRSWATTHR